MTYFALVAVFLLSLHCTSGVNFCSDTDSPVECVPCNGKTGQFKCPRQCGNERHIKLCPRVCSDRCVNSECEYDATGSLRCLRGCVGYFTGPFCQQICMDGCDKCTQDNKKCERCQRGRFDDTCTSKCNSCKGDHCSMDGACLEGCKPGSYGERCQKLCDKCMTCENDVTCEVCHRSNGTCILGCRYGYYGRDCQRQCMSRCTQCHFETGECMQCQKGFELMHGRCKRDGTKMKNQIPDKNEIGEVKAEEVADEKEEEKEEATVELGTSVAVSWPDEELHEGKTINMADESVDYLLPAVLCLVVIFATTTIVLFCKLRKRYRVRSEDENIETEKMTMSKSKDSKLMLGLSRSGPLYTEIPAGNPLKKNLDAHRPQLFVPASLPAELSLSRTGSTSTPYMTPVEDSDDEIFRPRTSTLGFEPTAGLVKGGDPWGIPIGIERDANISLVFENESVSGSCYENSLSDPFSLKTQSKSIRSYEIPIEYLDMSQSGRSTPRTFDM